MEIDLSVLFVDNLHIFVVAVRSPTTIFATSSAIQACLPAEQQYTAALFKMDSAAAHHCSARKHARIALEVANIVLGVDSMIL